MRSFSKLGKQVSSFFVKSSPRQLNASSLKLPSGLPEISFHSFQFSQQAFGALQSKGGFIVNDLGWAFSLNVENLFVAYDDFLAQPMKEKEKFKGKGELSELRGYFPYGMFFAGSKICDRYFIDRNSRGEITHPLPSPTHVKKEMKAAVQKYAEMADRIIWKTVRSIDDGLGLKHRPFNARFQQFGTLTIADSYLPLTQEKLADWMANRKLTKTSDGKIETFLSHKDLMPISILTYRQNQCVGLEAKLPSTSGKTEFFPVSLGGPSYKIKSIVLGGKVLEHLTDGVIQACEHRVVSVPISKEGFFSRYALNTFVNLDSEKNRLLEPLFKSPKGPQFFSTPMRSFFEVEAKKYLASAEEKAVVELPKEELDLYPTEGEIERLKLENGSVVYRRMS